MSRLFPLSLLPLLLSGCAVEESVEEHTFDGPVDRVVLDAGGADVQIVAVDGLEGARVVERTSWQDERPEVRVELVEGSLFVAVDCQILFTVGTACSADFDIEVPAAVAVGGTLGSGNVTLDGLVGGVDLETGSGDIELTDLAGDVAVRAGSGNVTGRGLSAAAIDIVVSSGDIDLVDEIAPDDVSLEAGAGNIDLAVPAGAYAVETSTSSGDVSVSGIDRDQGAERTIELRTGSGDITLVGR